MFQLSSSADFPVSLIPENHHNFLKVIFLSAISQVFLFRFLFLKQYDLKKRVKQIQLFLNYKEKQETIPSFVTGLHYEIVETVAPHLNNDSKYISWASGMMEKKFQSTKQFGSIKASLDSDWDGFFEFIIKIG